MASSRSPTSTTAVPDWLRRLAACPPAHGEVPRGFERLLDERRCIFVGPRGLFMSVYPFRLPDVAAAVEEARAVARARGMTRFEWWIARFRAMLRMFDVIRVDHFRGFVTAWEVPVEDDTAENGQWVHVPGHELFNLAALRVERENLAVL